MAPDSIRGITGVGWDLRKPLPLGEGGELHVDRRGDYVGDRTWGFCVEVVLHLAHGVATSTFYESVGVEFDPLPPDVVVDVANDPLHVAVAIGEVLSEVTVAVVENLGIFRL